jgi:hypothetical protein
LDAEKRGDLYREAQHIVQADGGTIVPMFADSVGAHRRDLSGFDLHPQKNAQDFSEITIGS